MCGLVGVIGSITAKERTLFREMLLADVVRGAHSTGVAVMTSTGIEVYKKAMPSYDFLELPSANAVIDRALDAMIGHNRHATFGAKTSSNAHPFVHGDIALVHNGTLTNKNALAKGTTFATDSEAVAYNLSLTDDPIPVLESLEGAYALIWVHSDGIVYLAKNDERPLHWFSIQRSVNAAPSIVFSSEKELGVWAISRGGFTIVEDGEVPIGKLVSIDTTTLALETTPFTVKQRPATGHGTFYQGGRASKNYVYPQNMTVEFTVDSIVSTQVFATVNTTSPEHSTPMEGKDLELYTTSQSPTFRVGGKYRAKVLNIEDTSTIHVAPWSVKASRGTTNLAVVRNKQQSLTGNLCGWCNAEITKEEAASGGVSWFGNERIHNDCMVAFNTDMAN